MLNLNCQGGCFCLAMQLIYLYLNGLRDLCCNSGFILSFIQFSFCKTSCSDDRLLLLQNRHTCHP